MPCLFEGPKLKVERAKRHICELDTEISTFRGRERYRIVIETDTTTHWHQAIFRVQEDIPAYFAVIIGDVVHNLRSALDLLACELVRLNRRNDSKVYFPFAKTRDDLVIAIKRARIDRAGPEVVTIIRSLKPYKGGDDTLRAIHDLNIMDKHKLLIPIWQLAKIDHLKMTSEPHSAEVIGGTALLKDGDKLFGMAGLSAHEIKYDFKWSFDIAFGEGQPLEGESVIPTLYQLASLAKGIVQTFETHFTGSNP